MTSVRTGLNRLLILLVTTALAACGGSSGSGNNNDNEPPPDTTAPTVSAVSVPAGSTVNRVVTLSATATDAGGVAAVRFLVDGNLLGTDTQSPYSIDWDTSAVADGDHVLRVEADDTAGNTGQSAEVTVTVANVVQFLVALSGEQEVPAVESTGTAQGDITVNLGTGAVSGSVTVNGITPSAAHIHDGFAGATGNVVIGLDQDAGDASLFTVPAGTTLEAAGVDRLLAGALYLNVHSAAVPSGELRGQLLPENFVLLFTDLEGAAAVPSVGSLANGRAAITLDQDSGTIVVQANVRNLDDATQAHVHEAYAGDTGPVLVGLNQDGGDAGRWFVEDGELNAAGLEAFAAGRLYVNVHSPANPGGELRGQIVPDGIEVVYAELSGEQSVPVVDTRAGGTAAVTLDAAASSVTIHVNTRRLGDASGAHLHGGFGGTNGPLEIGLLQDGGDASHWFAEEESLTAAQLDAVLAGATYINVHTPANSDGEVRAQVIPGNILFAFGRLAGSQVIPPVDTAAGGSFAVTVDPDALTLEAHANTTGADDASAAHLHEGYAGAGGGISVDLVKDAGDAGHWSAEGATIDAAQLEAFRAGRLYVNVHTPANGSGEIRGQVAPPPVEVLFTALTGDQEVPPVASAAAGTAASTVNRETGAVTLHLRTSGADDAGGAHIHGGYAGQNGGVVVPLEQDAGDAAHWSAVEADLGDAGLADYLDGRLYVNLHTPANGGGEIRGQIAPRDIQVVFTDLSGDEVVPPVATAATGKAATTTNLATRGFVAFVNNEGADDATGAGIYAGGKGTNGSEILPLQQTAGVPSQWSAMAGALSPAEFADYRAGGLYAQVATPAQPNGELRGQIDPPDAAFFDNQAPTVTLGNPGATVTGTVTLEATASDERGVVVVRFLADGNLIDSDTSSPYSASWDTETAANGQVTLTAEAEDEAGNVGTSDPVTVTVDNPEPVTLTQIQQSVFTPTCSGCHSGPTSDNLPSGMNLSSAANSFNALVNVPSLQVAQDRVEPFDPDNSYLIRKLEGDAGIVGSQMPRGGPFLDQPTIDMIRQWITEGAQNN